MDKENELIFYKDEDGGVSVNTCFADEDVWLTQAQQAEIYQTSQENISMHISNIYADGELEKEGTYKKNLLVRQEGKRHVRRSMDHYNLDMIITLGYKVPSPTVNGQKMVYQHFSARCGMPVEYSRLARSGCQGTTCKGV